MFDHERLQEIRRTNPRPTQAIAERLAAGLRGEIPPTNNNPLSSRPTLAEQTRGTVRQVIIGQPGQSAPMPRKAYGTPKNVTPTFGRHRPIRYREDWNCDGSGYAEVHDLIAGGVRRYDADGQLLLAASGSRTFVRDFHNDLLSKQQQRLVRDPWEVVREMLVNADAAEEAQPVPAKPVTSRRELQQRTSKRQRLMLKAVRLTQEGAHWDDLPKLLGITQAKAREMRAAVIRIAGPYGAARREKCPPRDFVGRFAKKPKSTKSSVMIEIAS